jgi:hypothetical protein
MPSNMKSAIILSLWCAASALSGTACQKPLLLSGGSLNLDGDPSASIATEGLSRYGPLLADRQVAEYVNLLAKALARYSPNPKQEFAVAILASETPALFSTPKGTIFVTLGVLRAAQTEAELAGALGREIARVCENQLQEGINNAGTDGVSEGRLAASLVFDSGFDEEASFRSDTSGADIAAATGYNPWGLKRLYEFLGESTPSTEQPRDGALLRAPQARVERLGQYLQENYGDFTLLPWNGDRYYERVASRLEKR